MGVPYYIIVVTLLISALPSSSILHTLTKGSSLSVEKTGDVLISENGLFSSGFYNVGENAHCFAIWYTDPLSDGNRTVVWMANRNALVNGRRSKLSLLKTGNLELTDAGQFSIWSTNTHSTFSLKLELRNSGNLVLYTSSGDTLWQSFDSPTNTLLPHQLLTKDTALISSISPTNYSSGFYQLFFDSDNTLRLQFNGRDTTSVYWYDHWLRSWEAGRTAYNSSRIAVLDSFGHFTSSDELSFVSTDYGFGPLRRLTLDCDGNIRLYSLRQNNWEVTWQAFQNPCKIHGVCGPNMFCTIGHESGRGCSCVPGYKIKNETDWSYGCEPMFEACQSRVNNSQKDGFVMLRRTIFYGSDISFFFNYTFRQCKKECLKTCSCMGFNYKYDHGRGKYVCYPKALLLNGYQRGFLYPMYIRIPKTILKSKSMFANATNLQCSAQSTLELSRIYKKNENGVVKFMLFFICALGGVEILVIFISLYMTRQPTSTENEDYKLLNTGFRRFSYSELKKASGNFKEEIGRGSGGVVYKGLLSNNRVAAIKRLEEANQGEAEFLAEISTIGRLHHMNLIDIWGYCVERKHRLLVYEYMENGSLAGSLGSGILNWEKMFNIAMGTAKGLAYLHEECLEWVLHCDVKPHNILLGYDYNPKVSDFGLSKLLNRGETNNSTFSRMRGTRGYMAPEWIFNLPITSKVDVYSYGVVILEMITGRSPTGVRAGDNSGKLVQTRLVTWVKEKMGEFRSPSWIEEIVDPILIGKYDMGRMEVVLKVAMQCVQEDRESRPTMRKVVDMLLRQQENY